jgi:pilus assembly protein CpaE
LTRRLRAHHATARIPVLMVSGRTQPTDLLAGYSEGADDYLTKPVELAILGAKVEALLRRVQAAPEPKPRQGAVMVFVHGKGGVGTTTLAVNAAVALSTPRTHRVALLDLSLEYGNAAMLLDVQPRRTLAHLQGVAVAELAPESFAQFVVEHASGVQVLSGADAPEHAELVTVLTVQHTLDRLRAEASYVLVDTAAAFTEVTLAAVDTADVICLITAPHLAALKASRDCATVLEQLQVAKRQMLLILNRSTPRGLEDEQVAEFFNRKPDVVIPYNPMLDYAADSGQPWITTHPNDLAAIKMQELAARAAALVMSPV